MATGPEQREKEATAYRDGYRAGYGKGIEDGAAQGYSDCKARAWTAFDIIEAAHGISRDTLGKFSHALTALIGKRS